jgi:hypothetical protein
MVLPVPSHLRRAVVKVEVCDFLPRQLLIDTALLVTIDDGSERGGQIGLRIDASMSEAMVALFSCPSPSNRT